MTKFFHYTEETKRKIPVFPKGKISWNKGHPCTEETKRKISEANMGKAGWNKGLLTKEETKRKQSESHKGKSSWIKGLHHTEETKKSISKSNKGRKLSNRHKQKISEFHKGKRCSEEMKRKMSVILLKRWEDPEYVKKMSEVNQGKHLTEEQKRKISESQKGRIPWNKGIPMNEKTKCALLESHKGKHLSEEQKKKVSVFHKGRKRIEETKQKISTTALKRWQDPEFAKKMGKAWAIFPNKPEQFLIKLLDQLYPSQWKYTGDFSFIVNGKNPDFVNVNGQKKIIELFGDYWHKGDDPQDRIDTFKPFGFETLVIWESELKNIERIKFKIHRFMKE